MSNKAKKPDWVIEKERARRDGPGTYWLFGIHAVRDALENPLRKKHRLLATKNAVDRLGDAIATSGLTPELQDPRHFRPPIETGSVHQGAVLEVDPLDWGDLSSLAAPRGDTPVIMMLDRVSDPHNVGAILRSAEVFGARAVVAPHRHSAPETGALAKTASGALERQPYIRIQNLARGIAALQEMGYFVIGLDGEAEEELDDVIDVFGKGPLALIAGAEGPGLRQLTKESCDKLAKISFAGAFGSLNVSNAAAVSLYAAKKSRKR
ncbi:MAG: 23S rRNA (guanosine(2251)-2'-O)-methyltransferase RlmB [Pseudomonadota bacterium]